MTSLGSTLICIGFFSYLLPMLGYQFKVVTVLGRGGGAICIGGGLCLFFGGLYLERRKIRKGDPFVNAEKLDLPSGQIPQDFFIKLHLFAVSYGGNNASTVNTLKMLHRKMFKEFAEENSLQALAESIDVWAEGFPAEIEKVGGKLNMEDKITLVKSIYVLSHGDGEVSTEEMQYLQGISCKLGLTEDQAVEAIKDTNVYLRAA